MTRPARLYGDNSRLFTTVFRIRVYRIADRLRQPSKSSQFRRLPGLVYAYFSATSNEIHVPLVGLPLTHIPSCSRPELWLVSKCSPRAKRHPRVLVARAGRRLVSARTLVARFNPPDDRAVKVITAQQGGLAKYFNFLTPEPRYSGNRS